MGKMHGFDIRVVKENTEKMAKVMGFDNEMVEKGKKGGVVLYGTTRCGIIIKDMLKEIGVKVNFFIDRLKVSDFYDGIPVFNFEEVKEAENYLIINCASINFWNITEFLFEKGIDVVYHGLPLLERADKDDTRFLLGDTLKLYKHYVEREEESNIYKVSVIITERCSLHCKYCAEYMPYIKGKNMDISMCERAIEKLLEAIGKLESLTVIGGEVFVHPDWYEFVEWCVDNLKIQQVNILTNSTIIPSKRDILKNEKVFLMLDDYGKSATKLRELVRCAEEEGIKYTVIKHEYWYDILDCSYIEESEEECGKKYEVCRIKGCWNISEGYLYKCTTSYYKMKYMLSKNIENEADFIDLQKLTPLDIKSRICELAQKKYLEACKYCIGTDSYNIIGVAEQL